MFTKTLSHYIGTSPAEVENLLSFTMAELYENSEFRTLIKQLDTDLLYETLHEARRVMDTALPPLVARVMKEYRVDHFPLSSFMLGNWVVGFLRYPDELWRMTEKHIHVPPSIIREVAPEILNILAGMKSGGSMWQRAFATVVLPLASESREYD